MRNKEFKFLKWTIIHACDLYSVHCSHISISAAPETVKQTMRSKLNFFHNSSIFCHSICYYIFTNNNVWGFLPGLVSHYHKLPCQLWFILSHRCNSSITHLRTIHYIFRDIPIENLNIEMFAPIPQNTTTTNKQNNTLNCHWAKQSLY